MIEVLMSILIVLMAFAIGFNLGKTYAPYKTHDDERD